MSDFFVKEDGDATPKREVKKEETSNDFISNQYIPIKFDSIGKLDMPKIIHVRNYTMDDALELSLATNETSLRTTIAVIGGMIKEGIDAAYLHEDELREILITIYASYWNNELPFPFPFTDEELEEMTPEDRQKAPDIKANIPIENVKTNTLPENFKEPIKIVINDQIVYFRLSRLKDVLEAQDYVEQLFMKDEREISNIVTKVDKGTATIEEKKQYDAYVMKKNKELMRAVQASVIVKVGSKSLSTLQEKIKYYRQIGIPFWKAYGEITDKISFGINKEVEVIHPLTHKSVTRRFQFRFLDFLSALEIQDDTGYTFEFGD